MRRANVGWSAAVTLAFALGVSGCEPAANGAGSPPPPPTEDRPPKYVALAGGAVRGRVGTNSLQALEQAASDGHRAVQVDLCRTSDGHLVLLADWSPQALRRFGASSGLRSREAFLALRDPDGLTPLDLDGLARWMAAHPGILVVLGLQGELAGGLEQVAHEHPDLLPRFVAQIHHPEEEAAARRAGYERLILSFLRQPRLPDEDILQLTQELGPWAVTIPLARARGRLPRQLDELGFFCYAYALDEYLTLSRLLHRGLAGAYTSLLSPAADWAGGSLADDDWTSATEGPVAQDGQFLLLDVLPVLGTEGATLRVQAPRGARRDVRLHAYDPSGTLVGELDLLLPAGLPQRELPLAAAFPGRTPAWIAAAADLDLEIEWIVFDRPAIVRRSMAAAARRWTFTGPGRGFAGLQLVVLNPGEKPVTYRIESDGGARPPPEIEPLAPGHVRSHVVPFVTDERLRVTLTGGPLLVQPLRADRILSRVR